MNTAWSSRSLDAALLRALRELATEERHNKDSWGNGFEWVTLKSNAELPAAAALLAEHGARLCTVTALNRQLAEPITTLAYHFDVHVEGNTNPKRLFLDPEIDEGILNEVIPLTIMMNGACTKDMWERIMEVNEEPGQEAEDGGRA